MLSIKEIRNTKFPGSVGGYRREDVDMFLDCVESDYEEFDRIIRELNGKLEAQQEEIKGLRDSQDSIQNVLLNAQRLADQMVEEARIRSSEIVAEAQRSVEEVVRNEQELSAGFEEKATQRKTELERELTEMNDNAERKRLSIATAAADSVRREQMLYDKLRLEIVAFKTEITKKYQEHLALLDSLPDSVPSNPQQIAQAVSMLIDQEPDPAQFVAPAATYAEPESLPADPIPEAETETEPEPAAEPVAAPAKEEISSFNAASGFVVNDPVSDAADDFFGTAHTDEDVSEE